VNAAPGRPPRVGGHDEAKGSTFPVRATAIVLAAWVVVLLLLALFVVPLLFGLCRLSPSSVQ